MSDLSKNIKKKVLIFSEYYLPGYKSGGGMRTIVNIVSALKNEFDFYIVTSDHDGRSDRTPYKSVKINGWNEIEGAQVFYTQRNTTLFLKILELYEFVRPDVVYSNSYFSTFNMHLLVLNRLGRFKRTPYLISPCGELSAGAMKVSLYKKRAFIFFAKILKFHHGVVWKATNETEMREIKDLSIEAGQIHIAPDLIGKETGYKNKQPAKPEKLSGSVKFVFLSRFSEKKNFKFFIENLHDVSGDLIIDIYGPIDDREYWRECEGVIANLPPNIHVEYKGAVPHKDVFETLRGYHFFVMPTLGENFGHVFLEALAAGCPLLISDRTPWVELEKKRIGWDIRLEDPDLWKKTIKSCVEMGQREFSVLHKNSFEYAKNFQSENDFVKKTFELLNNI